VESERLFEKPVFFGQLNDNHIVQLNL